VVLYGSFARGDHATGSDIDLLAAVRSERPITHGLYREWDELAAGSRTLRRDRELAFHDAEDPTPSGFYTRQDAIAARDIARQTVAAVKPLLPAEA
jgi:predicted nucleotidyltransferase